MDQIKNMQDRFDGNQLKMIAVITMFIDHIGYLFLGRGVIPQLRGMQLPCDSWYVCYQCLRTIGRVAFPIYAFLLVEGFTHTRDWKKYARNLGIFALISEVPFNLMAKSQVFDSSVQNVYFTLLIGLLMLKLMNLIEKKVAGETGKIVQLLAAGAAGWLAWTLKTDYDFVGIFLIAVFYVFRFERFKACALGIFWMTYMLGKTYYLPGFLAAFGLIWMYNGKRGKTRWKYGFYLAYPVHMLVFYGIFRIIFS